MRRLEEFTIKGGRRLRLGYTTGSCAAAAAAAAARILLGFEHISEISLTTPSGLRLTLDVEERSAGPGWARCAVRKDAGDDPDITDGILIYALARKIPAGIEITGGRGIGRVTKPGLALEPGCAAINPVPLKMIREQAAAAMNSCGYAGGLAIEIFAPDGEALAKRTFNPRLGIEGGISILGTSGLVEPMSVEALLTTIRAEIDQKAALGAKSILLVPGNYGQSFARKHFGLSVQCAVKCSNYIGETLDYAVYRGFERILLIGHAGKLIKLAAGVMNTHSSVADARAEILTAHAALNGISPPRAAELMQAATVDAADALLRNWGVAEQVWAGISERAAYHLGHRVKGCGLVGFAAFVGSSVVMRSKNLDEMLDFISLDDSII